ncbi:MAG: hypothetical protein Q4C00_04800 [Bacillota bacterium]|nr:hypothetical protein [Bacillota bacterium]
MRETYFIKIENLLPGVLDKGTKYTPASAAEEFRQEYPEEFNEFMKAYSSQFEFSGCGQRRGHINGFAIILEDLAAAGIMKKSIENAEVYWVKL